MKNKIIFSFLFVTLLFLNVVCFASDVTTELTPSDCFTPNQTIINEVPQRPLTLEEWQLSSDLETKAKTNGYISTFILSKPTGKPIRVGSYYIYILNDSNGKLYINNSYTNYSQNCINIKSTSSAIRLSYSADWNNNWDFKFNAYNLSTYDFNLNAGQFVSVSDDQFISTVPIYTDDTFSGTFYEPDDTIGDPSSDLQLSYQYNEDNTSCHIDATLKGGEFTDQIYYSNYQFDLEGKLKTKKPFPKAGIDITENQALYFQAEDKDGNIKAKNTMNIYGIGKLDPNNFIVNIDTSSQSAVIFSAKLLNDGYIYNSINCKISDTENLGILKGLSYMTSDFKEYNEIGQNEEYKIKNFSNDRKKITLYFQIKNKVTGKVMLTKSYDIDLKSTITESDFSTIDSGIINEGQDDEQIMTPDNDPNFGKNNGSLDFDWNFDTAKNSIEEFFTTAKEMFNLIINFLNQLPKWVTIPLYTLFMMAIIIFVFHVIRG